MNLFLFIFDPYLVKLNCCCKGILKLKVVGIITYKAFTIGPIYTLHEEWLKLPSEIVGIVIKVPESKR